MAAEPEIFSELNTSQALDRDPLTSYLGPHCERVLDTGETHVPVTPILTSSVIVTESEGSSESTIATIKEEPVEPESLQEQFDRWMDDEPSAFEESTEAAVQSHWNLSKIWRELGTNEQSVKFAIDRGLIPAKKMCTRHKKPMNLTYNPLKSCLGRFRCDRQTCRRRHVSRGTGTWFQNAKLPINAIFQVMYMFSHKYSYDNIQKELTKDNGTIISDSSIAYWYAHCREAIIVYHLDHQEAVNKIGGPGKKVYIEQSKVGERKFKISKRITGQWAVGLMEKGSDDVRLELCPDSQGSAEMLLPLIVQKHIEVGTEIHTDSWIANHCLSQGDFTHKTGKIGGEGEQKPLQPTESNWRKIKAMFKRDRFKGNFTDWLVEYSWRRNIRASNKCPFEELLKAVQYSY